MDRVVWIGKKVFVVESLFYRGVLAFLGGFVVVNGGEVVVNCVVNRGAPKTLFGRQTFFLFLKKKLLRFERQLVKASPRRL